MKGGNNMRKRILASAAALLITLSGALIATGTPAQAASAECSAPFWSLGTRGCTTGTISAHPSGRYIDVTYWGCRDTRWKVWDTGTGVTVASGRTPSGGHMTRRIGGLYGSYKAQISMACWKDRIRIDNT
ncbi:hypothetical protein GCM10022225_26440 [Plantactinospora mayteni]|uniref:Secreted protein n=1 Tax=Plantactinospora mayteni TaxID=566021 RepID=A0ABQ4EIR3_9ACTN|nr:hypothetical protein [Plantactinospora mayteni]GIG94626.1 hypothetical protein Pma05_11990 [Plantactinospora mayteni]